MGEAAARAAVAELEDQGYLDDARYVQRFTEDRRSLDGWGTLRIERRLLDLGVSPELIEAALGGRGAEDELQAAVAVLRRRGGGGVSPTDERERQRALGMLVRRGYTLELAYDAVRRLEGDRAQGSQLAPGPREDVAGDRGAP